MKCKQAKSQLALLIGNDLEPTALQEIHQHLGQCVGCRQHFKQLSTALEVLQAAPPWSSEQERTSEHESLWPRLSVRLASPVAGERPHRLNGWAPSLAVAAACLTMFWVVSSQWMGEKAVDPAPAGFQRSISQPASFEPSDLPAQNGFEPGQNGLAPRRRPSDDSAPDESGKSDIIRRERPGLTGVPVVPVSQPSH